MLTDQTREVFFHSSKLLDADASDVTEGHPVRFDQRESDKGPEAIDVELVVSQPEPDC